MLPPCWNNVAFFSAVIVILLNLLSELLNPGLWLSERLSTSCSCPEPPVVHDHLDSSPSRLLEALITFDLPSPVRTKPPLTTVDSFREGGPRVTLYKLNYIHSQALKNPLPSDVISSHSTSNMSVTEVRPLWHWSTQPTSASVNSFSLMQQTWMGRHNMC